MPLWGCAGDVASIDLRTAERRLQRAFDGAPPVIPHAVRSLQRQECLSCHGEGLRVHEEGLAPSTPHPERILCRQCHAERLVSGEGPSLNTFRGLRNPARGKRDSDGAPPAVPHELVERRNCLGCHGDLGGSPIVSPHADRSVCLQCHRPDDHAGTLDTEARFRGE